MYKITESKFIRFVESGGRELSLIQADIFCDTSDDLPDADAVENCILDIGSIAYIINAGELYVLNSEGEWKNANGDVEALINANTRQISEPISDTTKELKASVNEPESVPEEVETK